MSWAAVVAGAVVSAAVSLVLVALGSGFGLASILPWPGAGASAAAFTVMTAIWLIVVQWSASGTGAYLTGRLRTKWVGVHTSRGDGGVWSFAGSNTNRCQPSGHDIDARSIRSGCAVPVATRAYLAELVQQRTGSSQEEAQQRVDSATAQAKAAAIKARQAVHTARKAAAEAFIFTALSMVIGAFIACIAAAPGGRQRDEHI